MPYTILRASQFFEFLGAIAGGSAQGEAVHLSTSKFQPVAADDVASTLADIVQVVAGDAFKEIPKVQGSFDLVFLDAWKPDYKKFFDLVFPRVAPGGLFLAHNVINKKNEMLDFLAAIEAHPQAMNSTVSPGHEGISITYKKR